MPDLKKYGLDPHLVHYGHDPLQIPETRIDVLVVDYGALWQVDMGDWTRGLLRWADDHPSSLVLIWSSMTADFFVDELRDKVIGSFGSSDSDWAPPWPNNLRAMHMGSKLYAKWGDGDGVDWYGASVDFVSSWFGVGDKAFSEVTDDLVAPEGE